MKDKLKKFGLNIDNFNVNHIINNVKYKEFSELYKNHSIIGKNLKEIFAIFTSNDKESSNK